VCKEGLGVLGDRRIADLSRWFEVASEALKPDTSDIPFADDYGPEDTGEQFDLDDAKAQA
jgi:hypothetical protein